MTLSSRFQRYRDKLRRPPTAQSHQPSAEDIRDVDPERGVDSVGPLSNVPNQPQLEVDVNHLITSTSESQVSRLRSTSALVDHDEHSRRTTELDSGIHGSRSAIQHSGYDLEPSPLQKLKTSLTGLAIEGKNRRKSVLEHGSQFSISQHLGVPTTQLEGIRPSSSTGDIPQRSLLEEVDDGLASTMINFNLASLWIQYCEQYHGAKCDRRELDLQSSQKVNIILIDTRRNCLVEATTATRFLALSYVWGSIPQFQTTSSIFEALKQPQALSNHMHDIPQVICDAMQVVRAMGETYLWVDSLCITQDDATAKHDQITRMAAIYSGAILTIVAVGARNAQSSLPGVRQGTRWPRSWRSNARQINRPLRPDLVAKAIDRSLYFSRGWTFQERHLSRRCLYFLDEQLYFQCRTELWCEEPPLLASFTPQPLDVSLSIMALAPIWAENVRQQNWDRAFLFYSSIITEYSRKNLTYPEDVLDAFSGVLSSLEGYSGWSFLQGLPEQLFDWALLWLPVGTIEPRRSMREGRLEFPTWSWTGWIGGITFTFAFPFTLYEIESQIREYEIEEAGALTDTFLTVQRHVVAKQDNRTRDSAWDYNQEFFHGAPPTFQKAPDVSTPRDSGFLSGTILRFNASVANIANLETKSMLPWRWGNDSISHTGVQVPFSQKGVLLRKQELVCGVLLGIDMYELEQHSMVNLRLIALSHARFPPPSIDTVAIDMAAGYWGYRSWFEGNRAWSIVNIMLVEQSGLYSYLVAVGQIGRDVWDSLHPEDETIYLG
jgi:hypothetical protein